MLASFVVGFLQQLTDEQTMILSLLTLTIIQILKIVYYGLLQRPKLTKGQMRAVVFVLSVPIGYFFAEVKIPSFDDPMEFAQKIILLASTVLIWSGLVYSYMLNDLLGFVDSKILRRDGKRPVLAP